VLVEAAADVTEAPVLLEFEKGVVDCARVSLVSRNRDSKVKKTRYIEFDNIFVR
jgi:hypothetical protein